MSLPRLNEVILSYLIIPIRFEQKTALKQKLNHANVLRLFRYYTQIMDTTITNCLHLLQVKRLS